jgi:glutamate dehydrogenase/leucine dehydrogenase
VRGVLVTVPAARTKDGTQIYHKDWSKSPAVAFSHGGRLRRDGGRTQGRDTMKVVVIGGTGLIGSKLVTKLREQGHEALAASPNSGVNTLTGEGLAEVL